MAEQAVLVIDAGTSTIRCHVFDMEGVELAADHSAWPPSTAAADLPLAREWDPEAVLSAVYGLIGRVLGRVDAQIAAIAVTSMRQAVAFLDDRHQALYLGPNVDLRAVFEGGAIDEDHRDLVYRTTGHLPSFLFAPAKAAWMRSNRPELFGNIRTAVTFTDWLILRMTGELASERTLACEAGLLDVGTRKWATEMAELLGCPLDSEVPLIRTGDTVGRVNAEASAATGIPADTPVTSAGADTQCAALGMGVAEPGQVAIVAGWSAPVQQVTDAPAPSEHMATWTGCHLIDRRWVAEGNAGDTGRAYAWIAETTGISFAELEEASRLVEPGAEGTVAVLGPPRMDMSSVGLRAGGLLFPVPVTMNERGPGHLARAGMESVAFAIKANLAQLTDVTGTAPASIALGGGMARSGLFCDVVANVLDADILVLGRRSASALGAFVSAMTAVARFDSLAQGSGWAEGALVRVAPSPLLASEYEDHYGRWLEASSSLAKLQL